MSFIPVRHTNPAFNEQLGVIGAQVTELSSLCERALADTCRALSQGDRELAREISKRDARLNQLEGEVIVSVATAIARHNPVAHDLHALMGSVKMAQEFERLADHAKNIGRRVAQLIKRGQQVAYSDEISELGERTLAMLREFLAAEAAGDIDRAVEVYKWDETVNEIYTSVMAKALVGESEEDPRVLINTAFIAKNFERIGDKVKNLAEVAYYQKTGEILDFDDHEEDD